MPLSDLIAALEAATGPSRELDERMAVEVFGWQEDSRPGYWQKQLPDRMVRVSYALPAYTASLDAITGALEQRWPGCVWIVDNDGPDAELIEDYRDDKR